MHTLPSPAVIPKHAMARVSRRKLAADLAAARRELAAARRANAALAAVASQRSGQEARA